MRYCNFQDILKVASEYIVEAKDPKRYIKVQTWIEARIARKVGK